MQFPYLAILAAAVAAWVFGAAWYMALGRTWQRAQGLDPEACKNNKMPMGPMAASFLSELVMAAIFSQLMARMGMAGWIGGAQLGVALGVGFMATATLVNNAFPGRPITLTLIDGAHWILVAVIEGAILGALA